MRPITEWDVSDLQALIDNGVPESLSLDYKQSKALKNDSACRTELSKDVSAFANSDGGLIVFGIEEEGHLPRRLDDGTDPAKISREWIEQVINSTIKPRVQGIKIKQIELPGGNSAYVLEVPRAAAMAPHQANDHRYYKRFNFVSCPMEDYEVRDVQRRASKPSLYLDFEPDEHKLANTQARPAFRIRIGNHAPEPALYSTVHVFIEVGLNAKLDGDFKNSSGATFSGVEIQAFYKNLMVPHHQPVYRETTFVLGKLAFDDLEEGRKCFIGYRITSPGFFLERQGVLSKDGGGLTIAWSDPIL